MPDGADLPPRPSASAFASSSSMIFLRSFHPSICRNFESMPSGRLELFFVANNPVAIPVKTIWNDFPLGVNTRSGNTGSLGCSGSTSLSAGRGVHRSYFKSSCGGRMLDSRGTTMGVGRIAWSSRRSALGDFGSIRAFKGKMKPPDGNSNLFVLWIVNAPS